MTDQALEPYQVNESIFHAAKLTPQNIKWVGEAVNGTPLYTDGKPVMLLFNIHKVAHVGEVLVRRPGGSLTVLDEDTFDFFFNPQN